MDYDKLDQYTARLSKLMSTAKTERDVEHRMSMVIDEIIEDLGLDITGNNNVYFKGGTKGFADSVYSHLLKEYKKPNYFATKKGIDEALYGRNQKDRGLNEYILNASLEIADSFDSFIEYSIRRVGIGFDGRKFVFFRYVRSEEGKLAVNIATEKFEIPKLLPLKEEIIISDSLKSGLRKLIFFLRSTDKEELTSQNLVKRFGSKSKVSKKVIPEVYSKISMIIDNNQNSNVITIYNEWERLFGILYGDKDTDFTKVKPTLQKMYDFKGIEIETKKFLFTIHTYYNMILKFLVASLFESIINPVYQIKKDVMSLESNQYKDYIYNVISGREFEKIAIENFFEKSYYEWYLHIWDQDFEDITKDILLEIEKFETVTPIIKPENIGDLVKETYHDLMPKTLRHLLGEYFTPQWLVNHVLDEVGFVGQIGKKVLDATCGSGVFLTQSIKRKFEMNKELTHSEIIDDVLDSIVGFDINPISVISAKANYLFALGDLAELVYDKKIRIPIYSCDSVLVPTVHARQSSGATEFEVETSVGKFEIPWLGDREKIDILFAEIDSAICMNSSNNTFLNRLKIHNIYEENLTLKLYNQIAKLVNSGKDAFWTNILRTTYAPLFNEHIYDYVVGNPPWINWKSMSDTYRKGTLDIWLSYDIFEKTAYDKITTHDDFAMAVTYVCIDHYLKEEGGILGYVLPQTFLKSAKGGEGFRKFRITANNQEIPIGVKRVDDLVNIRPFKEGQKTSVIILEKGKETKFPFDNYNVWHKTEKVTINELFNLSHVLSLTDRVNLSAIPINEDLRSPWLTVDKSVITHINDILGMSAYRGRKGIEPLGCKWVYILHEPIITRDNKLLIKNDLSRGKLPEKDIYGEKEDIVEPNLVYPAVGGRNIDRWGINSYVYMIVPHDFEYKDDRVYKGLPVESMKEMYPSTYQWLYYFHDILLTTRKRSGKFYDEKTQPFYKLDNIGDYTFMPYKVVWREQKSQMTAAVVSKKETGILEGKLILTDSKVLALHLDNEMEAHYVCAVLNSSLITYIIDNYTIDTNRGIDILKNIIIPKFDINNKLHVELSNLSNDAHEAYKNNPSAIKGIEKSINEKVAKDLYQVDYEAIRSFLNE